MYSTSAPLMASCTSCPNFLNIIPINRGRKVGVKGKWGE